MEIDFTVTLPVDVDSVPFVRGLCRQALEHLAVDRRTVEEVVLALTEACANVVQHAGDGGRPEGGGYEVHVGIGGGVCRIAVLDAGEGFDPVPEGAPAREVADGGQGLLLMSALVDQLDFVREPDGRHRVTLEKRLSPPPALRLVDPV